MREPYMPPQPGEDDYQPRDGRAPMWVPLALGAAIWAVIIGTVLILACGG